MISHVTRSVVSHLALLLAICLSAPSTVLGQMSSADIAALRQQAEAEAWTFTVGENSATSRSLDQLCGLVEPEDWWIDAPFDPCRGANELPESWDWCDEGCCTPIRNQQSYGTCWAFATVGPLESKVLWQYSKSKDLSEQWLVSCNHHGWGIWGGWFAHGYHNWERPRDWCLGTGAVRESEFPYVGPAPCGCPYLHVYRISDWAYVGSDAGVPSVEAIKYAIYRYGPVSAAVYVDAAFQAYNGGVFNHDGTGQVNHGIVLVGWDDNQGSDGIWCLRNSWGTNWGEDGYMRIEYGCSSVGYAACYIGDVTEGSWESDESFELEQSQVSPR
jgi:C1A family cysteine protease